MILTIFDIILKWVLPYSVATLCLVVVIHYMERKYNESNLDLFWGRLIRMMILIGVITIGLNFIIHLPFWNKAFVVMHNFANLMLKLPVAGVIVGFFQNVNLWISQQWAYWSIIYFHAFSIVFLIGIAVEVYALIWRISFWRAFNVIWPVILFFPLLILKYLLGYQTPVQDFILASVLKAKLRENLNDSYENMDRGLDADGKPFKEGAGGSAQTQTRKAVNRAIKRSRVTVKTTSDGKRRAQVLVRQSRETETDRAIAQVLKGWGERVSGNSIYFPQDPTYSNKKKGYFFNSEVPFSAAEQLGSFSGIFENPFSADNQAKNGGDGFWKTYGHIYCNLIEYLIHLTPYAIYEQRKRKIANRYYIDTSTTKARYKVQHNLNLEVLPPTIDHEMKRTISEQRKIALRTAEERRPDVESALSSFKLYGQFKNVVVGGSQAIYTFTLPPDAKLPSDFDKIQNQMANLLHIREIPVITLNAGELKVSLNLGVNIPVSFADMIKKRPQGVADIISGLAGEDGLGNPIVFSLNDHVPHAILFGKTGTGKTVTINDILYSVMDATDPAHLQIEYLDGKGNSFEHLKNNPFTRSEPTDASSDINYARAKLINLEKECRKRIEIFKEAEVSKIGEYNKLMEKLGKVIMPEILLVFDEFSAVSDMDKNLTGRDYVKYNVVDRIEYLAKMARSVGIHMLLANQTARKEKVAGKISANIPGRLSLGVAEPVESEMALPETGIKVNLISQAGEFYSLMKGAAYPEHGNSPYLTDSDMSKLDKGLRAKFPDYLHYDVTREQMMHEAGLDQDDSGNDQDKDKPLLPKQNGQVQSNSSDGISTQTLLASTIGEPKEKLEGLPLAKLMLRVNNYAPYMKINEQTLIDHNPELHTKDQAKLKRKRRQADRLKDQIDKVLAERHLVIVEDRKPEQGHKSAGELLSQVVNGHSRQF